MKTKVWLVRAASLAVVGSLVTPAVAAKPAKRPHPKKAQSAAPPEPPSAAELPPEKEEGPFAPKGKTGKLHEEEQPEAEEKPKDEKAPAPPPPVTRPGLAGADIVFGFGKMGGSTGPDATELSVVSFLLGGTYQVNPQWGVRLRVPVSTGKITYTGQTETDLNVFENQGEGYNSAAFGNIELAANYTFQLAPTTKLPLELALAVPTAGGDRFPPPSDPQSGRRYRINAAAAASRGLEEDALFSPHRIGIVPAAYVHHQSGAIDVGAFIKVPVLIKAGGQPAPLPSPGQPNAVINGTIIQGVIGGDFHYGFLENKLDIGARAWANIASNAPYNVLFANETAPSKFQLVVEPQVRAAIGPVRAVLGFIFPVGGRLGGDQQVDGIRLTAVYLF